MCVKIHQTTTSISDFSLFVGGVRRTCSNLTTFLMCLWSASSVMILCCAENMDLNLMSGLIIFVLKGKENYY